jgi:hypothetical protein
LQKEILEETHGNSSRTHVITQVEESEVALNDKVGPYYVYQRTLKLTVFEEYKIMSQMCLFTEGW